MARRLSEVAASLVVVLMAPPAHADAIPPPRVVCAANETAVADHRGGHCEAVSCPPGKVLFTGEPGYPQCFDPPPASCPAGWTPEPGPRCALALCDDAKPCGPRTTCKATAVCTGPPAVGDLPWGAVSPRALLFQEVSQYRGACPASAACGDKAACREVRVCLPRGERSVAPAPDDARRPLRVGAFPKEERVLSAATMEDVLASTAEPPEPALAPPASSAPVRPVEVTTVAPKSARGGAGCAGCTAAGGATSRVPWLAALGLAVLVLRRRGRVCCAR